MSHFLVDIHQFFSLPCHVFWKNTELIYMAYNDFGGTQLGFSSGQDIIGLTDFEIFSMSTATIIRNYDTQVIQTQQQIFYSSERIVSRINMVLTFLTHKIPLFDQNQTLIGLLGISVVRRLSNCNGYPSQCEECLLSKREQDCVRYLSFGLTIKEVAKKLQVSPRTVETYITRGKIKLHCNSKSELISAFLEKTL